MDTIPSEVLSRIFFFVAHNKPGAAFILQQMYTDWKKLVAENPDIWVLPPSEYRTLQTFEMAKKWFETYKDIPIHAHPGNRFSNDSNVELVEFLAKTNPPLCCFSTSVANEAVPYLSLLATQRTLQQLILNWIPDSDTSTTWIPTEIPIQASFFPNLYSLHLIQPPAAVLASLARVAHSFNKVSECILNIGSQDFFEAIKSTNDILRSFSETLVTLRLSIVIPTESDPFEPIDMSHLEELSITRFGRDHVRDFPLKFKTPNLRVYCNGQNGVGSCHEDISSVSTLVQWSPNQIRLDILNFVKTLVIIDKVNNFDADLLLAAYKGILTRNSNFCSSLESIHIYRDGEASNVPVFWERKIDDQVIRIEVIEHSELYSDEDFFKPQAWACPERPKWWRH